MWELCLFLLLLNFDAFLTGLSFGVAGVKITSPACLLVAVLSALFFAAAMGLGDWLFAWLPTELLSRLALVFLLLFTVYLIAKYCGQGSKSGLSGLWRRPAALDNNADKCISLKEAALLGVALALDSLAGGLALGILLDDFLLYVLLSAIFCYYLLAFANRLGQYIVGNLQK